MYLLILLIYVSCTLYLIKRRAFLFYFFYFIYTLQFLPLFFPGDVAIFWIRGDYQFPKESDMSFYLLYILVVVLTGFLTSFLFMKKRQVWSNQFVNMKGRIPDTVNLILILFIAALILLKSIIVDLDLIFNGLDLLITTLTVLCFFFAFSKNNKTQFAVIIFLYFSYAIIQIIAGDRNFIGVIIVGMIFYSTFFPVNKKTLIFLSGVFTSILCLGVIISISRAGEPVHTKSLVTLLYYNSWSAIIRPLIDMLIVENYIEEYLYGKSYIDLVLSFAPTFLYELLGTVKPYSVDNPAFWYHVQGGGGMHAIGVAIKNFGLVGVYFQTLFFSLFIIKMTELVFKKNNAYYYAFFICISLSLMKSVWYSMSDFINVIALFFTLLIWIKFMIILLPKKISYMKQEVNVRYREIKN